MKKGWWKKLTPQEKWFRHECMERRFMDRSRAQRAIGRPLKPSEPIHHHGLHQLVVCQDASYHTLLHQRTRALGLQKPPMRVLINREWFGKDE